MLKKIFNVQVLIVLAAILGVLCGRAPGPHLMTVAQATNQLFLNAMRLVSMPIIFLSVASTISGMETVSEFTWLGRRVLAFTLATTVAAASLALGLFLWIKPVDVLRAAPTATVATPNYLEHVLNLVPNNFFQPFVEGNVLGVLGLAVAFGIALLHVSERQSVHALMTACLAALMKMTRVLLWIIPVVVWAGIVQSFGDLANGPVFGQLIRYLGCVIAANVIHAAVVLPLLLRVNRISPTAAFRGFIPALSVAFFSKSSVATIPIAMRCAETNLKVSPKVSKFTFPICTTINMNGCAAFILITVLFVSMSHGHVYSPWELGLWVLIATVAAVGNAGVPMGCYFLSSALLAAMNVPLAMMAVILPFYNLIDMLETAVNVWSDACVALLVDKQVRIQAAPQNETPALAT